MYKKVSDIKPPHTVSYTGIQNVNGNVWRQCSHHLKIPLCFFHLWSHFLTTLGLLEFSVLSMCCPGGETLPKYGHCDTHKEGCEWLHALPLPEYVRHAHTLAFTQPHLLSYLNCHYQHQWGKEIEWVRYASLLQDAGLNSTIQAWDFRCCVNRLV